MPETFKKLKILDLFSGIPSEDSHLALNEQADSKPLRFANRTSFAKPSYASIGLTCRSTMMCGS